jgi:hypothetical protein
MVGHRIKKPGSRNRAFLYPIKSLDLMGTPKGSVFSKMVGVTGLEPATLTQPGAV